MNTSSPKKSFEAQPHDGAFTKASANEPAARATRTAPNRSGRAVAVSSRLSGSTLSARNTVTIPTGMLIQNTQRHDTSTRKPPITGPRAAPSAPMADHVPIACARKFPGTAASNSDNDAGTIMPAPIAWTRREAIRNPTSGATPDRTEPSVKTTRPATNIRRRPIRSAQRPAGTRTAAKRIEYPLRTQLNESSEVPWKSRLMYGKARLTMKRSRLDMKAANDRTATIKPTRLFEYP